MIYKLCIDNITYSEPKLDCETKPIEIIIPYGVSKECDLRVFENKGIIII